MTSLSDEEENYIRLSLLLSGIIPRVVRSLFDREFAPASLQSTLRKEHRKLLDMYNRRILNQTQWKMLVSKQDSKNFDVSLMVCLLTNLAQIPGYQRLPVTTDTSIGADLARIKHYRTYFAHLNGKRVYNSYFVWAWNDISGVVQRLGGISIIQECLDLRTKVLDIKSNLEIINEVKPSQEEIDNLKQTVQDHVTGSVILDMIMQMDSRSIEMYIDMLKKGSERRRDIRIIVVGKKGSGKTSLVRRLLRQTLTNVTETNGIEIHIKKCRIRCEDGAWDSTFAISESFNSRLKNKLIEFASDSLPFSQTLEEDDDYSHLSEDRRGSQNDTSIQPEVIYRRDVQRDFKLSCRDKDIQNKCKEVLEARHVSDEYANVYIWDFAGDEEFYNTHQMFFAKDVIYLLLTNLNENSSEQHDAFKFWFNSVHVLFEDTSKVGRKQKNPPVIVVGTHTDLIEGGRKECEEILKAQISDLIPELKNHIRSLALISNITMTKDSEDEIDKLRSNIFRTGKETNIWNYELPVKFILLEDKLDKYKFTNINSCYLSLDEIKLIAEETDQPITELEELKLFLRFHHQIGNLIYFHDKPEYIILNPQWLVDIAKCVITADKFPQIEHPTINWKEVTNTGKLDKQILDTILSKQTTDELHRDFLLEVLERYDIIVRPKTLPGNNLAGKCEDYYVPCIVKTAVPGDIGKRFQVMNLTHKSTILCLEFLFLPRVIFNLLLISFCHRSEWSVATIDNRKQLAFFRNLAVFDLSANGCKKLFLTKYENSIQLQIWNFGKTLTPSGDIRKFIMNEIRRIARERVGMENIDITIKMKCPESQYETLDGMIDYDKMMKEPLSNEYFCSLHRKQHNFTEEWYGSSRVLNSDQLNFVRIGIITQDILTDTLFDLSKQDGLLITDRSQYDVTKLYEILRKNKKHVPSSGWFKKLRYVEDVMTQHTNIGDDIERIRLVRNEMQHSKTYALTKARSDQLFTVVMAILERFDQRLKPAGDSYLSRAQEVNLMTVTSYEMKQLQTTLSDGRPFDYQEMFIFTIVVLLIALFIKLLILL